MPFNSESARRAGAKSSRKQVPNKISAELKSLLNEVSRESASRIISKMDELTNKELISLLNVSAKYVIPALSSISADIEARTLSWNELTKEEKREIIQSYFNEKEEN